MGAIRTLRGRRPNSPGGRRPSVATQPCRARGTDAGARNGRHGMEARRTDARVAAMVAAHGEALRRVARRYSASAEDAEDAVQRGLEIYVRRLARGDPATELAWLKVVVRHEALAVGRARGEAVGGGEIDLDAQPAPDQRPLDELVAGRERAGRVAEAL